MAKRDELLFGASPIVEPDSDGDGVSDAQERLDGTDPTDASSVKHADPVIAASLVGSDPRGDLAPLDVGHVTTVDVLAAAPAGFGADQALPTGLDGKPIESGPNHHGVGNDPLLTGHVGRGVDASRDPMSSGHATASDPGSATPESEMATGSADPGNNPDLVAASAAETAAGLASGAVAAGAATAAASAASSPPAPEPNPLSSLDLPSLVKMSDPDAAGGTVTPTAEQFAHAVATQGGGVTDTVQGSDGRPQVDDTAPPASKGDLVTDPADPKGPIDVVTSTTAAPPGLEISHTINPADGFDPVLAPSTAGPGEGDGFASTSSAATAADATSTPSSDASNISVVDSGSSGAGIQTIADDSADTDTTAPVADDVSFQAPAESFSGLDLPDDLAIPQQVDLDDGF